MMRIRQGGRSAACSNLKSSRGHLQGSARFMSRNKRPYLICLDNMHGQHGHDGIDGVPALPGRTVYELETTESSSMVSSMGISVIGGTLVIVLHAKAVF